MFYECNDCKRIDYVAKAGSPFGNYARTSDSQKICYECAARQERELMISTGKATLYFERDKVTNWTGLLVFKLLHVRTSRHNMAGKRYDYWFVANGFIWHGYTIGDMTQIAHCKQTKERA